MTQIQPLGGYQPYPKPDPALPKSGRSKLGKTIPLRTRQELAQRSGGICERCRNEPAVHAHHRKLRRSGDHSLSNLAHLGANCHAYVHSSQGHAHALETGWIVSQYDDPAEVVLIPLRGEL